MGILAEDSIVQYYTGCLTVIPRALFSSFTGSLYQVRRGSDNAMTNIAPLCAGGVANAATQDSFCTQTTCVITTIFDQSGHNNHLTQAPPGGFNGPEGNGFNSLASATGAPVMLNGQKAYGVFMSPGSSYCNNTASSTVKGNAAQGMYAVLDGTHFNGACCFDYGNAETSSRDTGNGHMEAIYFGNSTGSGTGSGSGPWIMADLENGLFSGSNTKLNSGDLSISHQFVSAIVKGEPGHWAIRGADTTSGSLASFWDGARPSVTSYNPMLKEGAIILGIGGNNSNGAQGMFYEGVMTSSYPSDATENSVQANIIAAKYAMTSMTSGPALSIRSSISFTATTACCTTCFIAHSGATVAIQLISSSSNTTLKQQVSWIVRTGLGNSACFSFESVDTPGSFLRHSNFQLQLNANDSSKLFSEDAMFCPQAGLNGQGNSIQFWSFPTHFF